MENERSLWTTSQLATEFMEEIERRGLSLFMVVEKALNHKQAIQHDCLTACPDKSKLPMLIQTVYSAADAIVEQEGLEVEGDET